MQKILRRTQMAVRQAERRKLKKRAIYAGEKLAAKRQNEGISRSGDWDAIRTARKVQREDWELGPLAPRRDVGDLKERYGAFPGHRLEGYELLGKAEKERRLAPWGGKKITLKMGDRVAIMSGRDKGRIGKVLEVDAKKLEAKVEGLNMIDAAIPEWMLRNIPKEQHQYTRPREKPISLGEMRLVTALQNPETGETRDVIVKRVESFRKGRQISGTRIDIPWPDVEPEQRVQHPSDTPAAEVEKVTFIPTLPDPPMDLEVIDELRNKYSKFRTRHTPEYIAEKEQEEYAKQRRLQSLKMMRIQIPQTKQQRMTRKVYGGRLTNEMLERIGKVMAKNKGLKFGEEVPEGNVKSSNGSSDAAPSEGSGEAAPPPEPASKEEVKQPSRRELRRARRAKESSENPEPTPAEEDAKTNTL